MCWWLRDWPSCWPTWSSGCWCCWRLWPPWLKGNVTGGNIVEAPACDDTLQMTKQTGYYYGCVQDDNIDGLYKADLELEYNKSQIFTCSYKDTKLINSNRWVQLLFSAEEKFETFSLKYKMPTEDSRDVVLTVWVCDSSHERLLAHVAGRLLHQALLVRAVELLGKLHRLQCRKAARHAVDHWHRLRLRRV